MNRKIKLSLCVTLAVTVIMLAVCYAMIKLKADDYMNMLEGMGEGATWEDIEYGGLAFIAVFLLLIGTAIDVSAIPLLVAAVMLMILFVFVLSVREHTSQKIVALVVMITSLILTTIMLVYIVSINVIVVTFAQSSSTTPLSLALFVLMSATSICLIAHTVTSVVCYARLRKLDITKSLD